MKKFCVLLAFIITSQIAFAQIDLGKIRRAVTGNKLSTEEVANGLKEALEKGASKGSDLVSRVDGYYKNPEIKIPFPAEVQKVEDRLRQIGLGSQVDKFVLSINRAAEDAAKQAKPIFVAAIKGMTIQDAWSILRGEKDAATQYLQRTTTDQLFEKFQPVIKASLERVNATRYYSDLIDAYNKIPFVEKENADLDRYAAQKAIDGLFVMVAREEENIREDPGARTSELLKKVFGAQ